MKGCERCGDCKDMKRAPSLLSSSALLLTEKGCERCGDCEDMKAKIEKILVDMQAKILECLR